MKILEITTKIGCDNMCGYCPQTVLLDSYNGEQFLTLQNFKRILDNCNKDVQICFAGFSEPALAMRAGEMMLMALNNGYEVSLYTTLRTVSFTEHLRFAEQPFKSVCFHKCTNVDSYIYECNKNIFLKNVQSKEFTESTVKDVWSRAGNLFDRTEQLGKFRCETNIFDHNVVLPNGNVYLCCMDYGLKHCLGNIFETNFDDLDRQTIRDLANQEQSEIICRKCELFRK